MPKTLFGKLAVGLIILMPVFFFLSSLFSRTLYDGVPAGNGLVEDINLRPLLAYSAFAATVCGIIAFVLGLVAITKYKERALLVNIAVALGTLLLLMLVGELIFTH